MDVAGVCNHNLLLHREKVITFDGGFVAGSVEYRYVIDNDVMELYYYVCPWFPGRAYVTVYMQESNSKAMGRDHLACGDLLANPVRYRITWTTDYPVSHPLAF